MSMIIFVGRYYELPTYRRININEGGGFTESCVHYIRNTYIILSDASLLKVNH